MIPIKTPIQILDFTILNSRYSFIPYGGKRNIQDIMDEYHVEINYRFESANDMVQVYAKVSINEGERPQPGYSIFAEGVSVFTFDPDAKLDDEAKIKYANFSGIPVTLNNLRGFILSLTASGPLGRYILPSFDVQDLMRQKIKLVRTAKVVGVRKKKRA